MKVQFKVTVFQGTKKVTEFVGREGGIDVGRLTIADVTERVIETEQFLEKLTGLRVHIEQIL